MLIIVLFIPILVYCNVSRTTSPYGQKDRVIANLSRLLRDLICILLHLFKVEGFKLVWVGSVYISIRGYITSSDLYIYFLEKLIDVI